MFNLILNSTSTTSLTLNSAKRMKPIKSALRSLTYLESLRTVEVTKNLEVPLEMHLDGVIGKFKFKHSL